MKNIIFLLALSGACTLANASPGVVSKDSELRRTPMFDARTTGQVARQAKVEILNTRGGWVEVKTADGKTGWLRLMNVEVTGPKSLGSKIRDFMSGSKVVRTGSTSTTATTGIRGISKEDLAGAKPNFDELAQLDRYRASASEGTQHAASAGLKAQNVEPLPTTAQ